MNILTLKPQQLNFLNRILTFNSAKVLTEEIKRNSLASGQKPATYSHF